MCTKVRYRAIEARDLSEVWVNITGLLPKQATDLELALRQLRYDLTTPAAAVDR